MNDRRFHRRFVHVTIGHIVVLALVLVTPAFRGLFRRKVAVVTPIDFVVDTRTLKGDGEEQSEDPPAPPVRLETPEPPAPKPEAPKPKPKPQEIPKPKPPKPKEAEQPPVVKPPSGMTKIEVSRVKVRRPVKGNGGTPNPLTPEEIRRRLALGARAGSYNSAIPSEEARSFGLIYQALYQAWAQPSKESVGSQSVTASIRLELDGRVADRQLVSRSGIADFDASVQAALNAVDRIPGLTVSFLQSHRVVTVLFEVQ